MTIAQIEAAWKDLPKDTKVFYVIYDLDDYDQFEVNSINSSLDTTGELRVTLGWQLPRKY